MPSQTILDPASANDPLARPAQDRRGGRRLRTLKQGKIVTSNWTVMDCLIRDMSDSGARIALGGLADLPNDFRLLVVSSNMLVPAELEWQRGLLAGVRFTGPAQDGPATLTKAAPSA